MTIVDREMVKQYDALIKDSEIQIQLTNDPSEIRELFETINSCRFLREELLK